MPRNEKVRCESGKELGLHNFRIIGECQTSGFHWILEYLLYLHLVTCQNIAFLLHLNIKNLIIWFGNKSFSWWCRDDEQWCQKSGLKLL